MLKLIVFFTLSTILVSSLPININANEFPKDSEPCICLTTMELMPICGTDGITYDSKGLLECKNKCNKESIEVLHAGRCNTQEE